MFLAWVHEDAVPSALGSTQDRVDLDKKSHGLGLHVGTGSLEPLGSKVPAGPNTVTSRMDWELWS